MSRDIVKSTIDHRLRRAWAALMAVSLALVVLVAFLQQRHRSAMAAFKALPSSPAHRAAEARFRVEEQANPNLFGIRDPANGRWRMRRRDELAQSMFPGRTPTSLPVNSSDEVRWEDPVRGVTFHLGFRGNGTLSSYSLDPLPGTPPAQPWLLRVLRNLDPYRRLWVGSFTALTIGPILWMTLLVVSFFPSRAQRLLANGHLAVAWLCFLAWLLNPNYTVSFKGIFSNDMLFWGTLMVIASLFAGGFVAMRSPEIDPTRCPACGYDLTGNVSGVCPECGTSLAGDRRAPA
jgi:hypothetical protein